MKAALHKIPTFIPGSKLAYDIPEIVLEGVERFPHALDELGKEFEAIEEHSSRDFNRENYIAHQLAERFAYYGSDKSRPHDYHYIYGQILATIGFGRRLDILEIGIGSNNPQIPSNMGIDGRPGASLRAFRDVIPAGHVWGADIDPDILFQESGISTAFVDQMRPETFLSMHREFGNPMFDLVIDDGLHAVSANLNTLLFGLQVIKKGGWVVIEDIWAGKVCWHTVYRLLDKNQFDRFIISISSGCHAFVVHKKS